ncbi:MAG: hypothetical protein EXR72_21825 [Myxococcales bacterium]|nr:hypothetical protein [Myxococcales bacterium]
MRRTLFALAFTVAVATLAAADARANEAVLQNDDCDNMNCNLNFGGKVIKGEALGETFAPPANLYPFTVLRVQFIAANGKMNGKGKPTFKIYEDNGSAVPGKELASVTPKDVYEGNTMFVAEQDIPTMPVFANAATKVRVAVFFEKATADDGLTIPIDPTSAPNRGTICAIDISTPNLPCVWNFAKAFKVNGDFVLRLVVDSAGAPPKTKDMGGGNPGGDGGVSAGAPVVESITPSMIMQGMGVSPVILGKNFDTKATVVFKGPGQVGATSMLVQNGTSITVGLPTTMAAGSWDVIVQNPNGETGSLARAFVVTGMAPGGCQCDLGHGASGGGALVLALLLLLLPLFGRRVAVRALRSR